MIDPVITIHSKVISSDEGTCYYRKFISVEGKIIGEIIPCEYNDMRAKEVL